jgi:hypothetical protein
LLPLCDARSENAFALFIDSQQRMSEVVEREFAGSIHRGKEPLRLCANPLHRKAKRAVRAFS